MRIAAIAIVALCMAAPAAAEEVLYCTDTEASGFVWPESFSDLTRPSKHTLIESERFTVKVLSETKRMIQWPNMVKPKEYECAQYLESKNIHCVSSNGAVDWPIIFGKRGYTRAELYATPLGHLETNAVLKVAYGTCTKF